jgi:dissimilatory sulfite reductase related protein
MVTANLGGKELEVCKDGFLQNPAEWNDEVAVALAISEGVDELMPEHWKIIRYIREYYEKFTLAPIIRKMCRETDCDLARMYVLFPSGPAKGLCKIAGLPGPTGLV